MPATRRSAPPVVRFPTLGFACWLDEPEVMPRSHRHHDVEINFVVRGGGTFLHGGGLTTVRTGQLALLWSAMPHQLIRVEPGTRFGWVTMPLVWLLQSRAGEKLKAALLAGELIPRELPSGEALLTRWHEDLASKRAERQTAFLLELEALFVRLGLSPEDGPSPEPGAVPPPAPGPWARFETMARHLAERYREPLRVEAVARAAGLHPNYAMTLFRQHAGMSVGDYLTRHRVSHAQRLLVTGDDKVIDIAMSSGFNSLSRFYAAFQKVCGESPRSFRRTHRLPG